jgi:hypothetical protein
MDDDRWIAELAASIGRAVDPAERAPARLKARIYSALVGQLAATGPLLGLAESKACGGALCVFEEAVTWLQSERLGSMNPCNVCHARMLGERLEHAPIYWPHCPYAEFHKRSRE